MYSHSTSTNSHKKQNQPRSTSPQPAQHRSDYHPIHPAHEASHQPFPSSSAYGPNPDPTLPSTHEQPNHHRRHPSIHALPNVPLIDPYPSFPRSAYAPRHTQSDRGAMGFSEPNSPMMRTAEEEIDQRSNDSHPSDHHHAVSRSPIHHNRIHHPMGREKSSFDNSCINYQSEPEGFDALDSRFQNLHHQSTPDSLSPSFPAYGRYRQGAYGNDGLESGRASTVGTDTGFHAGMPHNSSRTALNREWRNSEQGSQDGVMFADEKYEITNYPTKDIAEDLNGSGGPTYIPIPPSSPAEDEKKVDRPTPDDRPTRPPPVVVNRQNRLDWIDGIRGLASLVIFTHHFSDLTWSQSHPDTLSLGSVYGLLRNGQLAVGMYFLLGGRVLAHSFLRSAFTRPSPPKDSHGVPVPGAKVNKWQGPRWLSLSSSLFRRSIRLAFPAIIVGLLQWQIASHGLLGDRPIRAARILAPSSLWLPTWNHIGNFWGFLQFCLDLFTNRGHQYMLNVGSALWSTYDQFWGSVLVYILAASVAQVGWIGRYLIYLVVSVCLWFINSPNMLYVLGLWLADLHAAGFVRKLQDHWKPTMLVECSVMILALALIAGGTRVATPADNLVGNITVYDGKFGWDQSLTWPQYMLISNWIPPLCILIWVEVSHAMQWLASWAIFVWLGKVSYGFYLMQFITLYSIMPPVIIHFNN